MDAPPNRREGGVMTRLAELAKTHSTTVSILAVIATLLAVPLSAKQQQHLSAGDTISSRSQSASVSNAIHSGTFPGAKLGALDVVLQPMRDARPGDLAASVGTVSTKVDRLHGISVRSAGLLAALASARAYPENPVLLPVDYGGGVGIDQAREVTRALAIKNPQPGSAAGGRIAVHLIGEGALWAAFVQRADADTKSAETTGLPIVSIVLLLAFGSLATALLPVALGVMAILIAGAVIYLLSLLTDMSIFAETVASMIGLGVAIDYSLFILVRYREEVRRGLTPEAANERAMATSGRAVAYSGLTVIVAQSALFLISSPGVRSIAAGAMLVVAISVLGASTVLPVMIEKLGRRAYEPGRLARPIKRRRDRQSAFWQRWTRVVMRYPTICLLGSIALLLALASSTLGLHVRNSATSQLPANNQVVTGMRLVERELSPGAIAPVQIMLSEPSGGRLSQATVSKAAAAIGRDPAVAGVQQTRFSSSGDRALITATLRVPAESQQARDAIDRLRRNLPTVAADGQVDIGGTTAIILDFDQLVTSGLWKPILFVLATSFLVLLLLLRSLVLPLKATLMNLLSVLASYGALVGVFQHGWLEPLGIHRASTIYPITMPLVLTLAVGLSMDYHIFMLSRIQERYKTSNDIRNAVADALASSAPSITSAALIMVVVFLTFVGAGAPSIQQLGFTLAVAVAIDATVVRLVVVPAAMVLLGEWNWWLPRPLKLALARPAMGAKHC
jgi:uncharacterized membrane protein YdfJ with MMPL/SSD domain